MRNNLVPFLETLCVIIISCSLFAYLIWTVTCCHLSQKPINLQTCLFLCPSSHVESRSLPFNHTWHSSFPHDTQTTIFKTVFPRVPRGNSGESNMRHTFNHYTFDVPLSPPSFPAHRLRVAFFLINLPSCLGLCFLTVIWENFLSIHFRRVLLFVFCPQSAPIHPILQPTHLFRPLFIGDHSWSSFWFSNKQHYLSRPLFLPGCNSNKLFNSTIVCLLSRPQNFKSARPVDWKKGGDNITTSPSSSGENNQTIGRPKVN